MNHNYFKQFYKSLLFNYNVAEITKNLYGFRIIFNSLYECACKNAYIDNYYYTGKLQIYI